MPKQPLYPMEWWESHKDEMIKLGQTGFSKKYGIGRQTVFNYWHKMGLPTERQRNKKPEWWKAHKSPKTSRSQGSGQSKLKIKSTGDLDGFGVIYPLRQDP